MVVGMVVGRVAGIREVRWKGRFLLLWYRVVQTPTAMNRQKIIPSDS